MAAAKKDAGLAGLFESGDLMLGDDARLDIHRLLTGIPQLDDITGGGLVYGRNVLVVGPESVGKTVLCQYFAAAQQGQLKNNKVLLLDCEMSFDRNWWAASGVDTGQLLVSQPRSAEQALQLAEAALDPKEGIGMVILDSIAGMAPTTVLEKPSGEKTIASLASLVTVLYQKMNAKNRHAIFVAINQMRANIGTGYDDVYPGGLAQKHASHTTLRLRRVDWIREHDMRVGQTIEVLAKKNKMGEPMGVCQIDFRFKGQLDLLSSYLDEAIERGLITAGGPWYTWLGEKYMGKVNLRNHFITSSESQLALKAAIDGAVR
jgi:recombination protein RecA